MGHLLLQGDHRGGVEHKVGRQHSIRDGGERLQWKRVPPALGALLCGRGLHQRASCKRPQEARRAGRRVFCSRSPSAAPHLPQHRGREERSKSSYTYAVMQTPAATPQVQLVLLGRHLTHRSKPGKFSLTPRDAISRAGRHLRLLLRRSGEARTAQQRPMSCSDASWRCFTRWPSPTPSPSR